MSVIPFQIGGTPVPLLSNLNLIPLARFFPKVISNSLISSFNLPRYCHGWILEPVPRSW